MKRTIVFYLVGAFFMFPIVCYYFKIPDILPYQGFIQVFLSAPLLLLLGLLMIFYKEKIIGSVFILVGVCWLAVMLLEIINK